MTAQPQDRLAEIARPSGSFAMVAMDQRESLRAMFAERSGEPVEPARRVAFKVAVARVLSPHASALLVDVDEGLEPILAAEALDPRCGLVIAADALVQPTGMPVEDTDLDRSVDLEAMAGRGAAAAKLLVIWRPDRAPADRGSLVRGFIDRSHAAGLAAIVEGVVRPPPGVREADWTDREDAVLEAARELGSHGPDVYKAQVPFDGRAEADAITAACATITGLLPCPWVVLSSGVAIEDFPAAVEAACRGGASGFLAGRAIWRDAIGLEPEPTLAERSVPRLQHLASIVDAQARPWTEAVRPG